MALRHYRDTFNRRQKVTADTNNLDPNGGFMVDLDGTVSIRLRNETSTDTIPVLAGHFYRMDVAQVDITGSTAVTEVTIFFEAPV